MGTLNNVVVYCDQDCDRALFRRFQRHSPCLNTIPDGNLKILPRRGSIDARRPDSRINLLLSDDRPDFVFCVDGSPVLVVEMTEHGYTGDNGLQRYTRLAIAAEGGCAAIYFTPFSRVRDDELDAMALNDDGDDEGGPIERHVNTDMFKGMSRLSEIFKVPLIALNWPNNAAGLPSKIKAGASEDEIGNVCGVLIQDIEQILSRLAPKIAKRESVLDDAWVKQQLEALKLLWANPNTRTSSVKIDLTRQDLRDFLKSPREILTRITKHGYFFKDKPERLLMLECIENAKLDSVVDGKTTLTGTKAAQRLDDVVKEKKYERVKLYQTGYKWRSDPHCGVVVNIDYNLCRTDGGKQTCHRDKALVVFWPRIFLSDSSAPFLATAKAIESLKEKNSGSRLSRNFLERYGSTTEAASKSAQLLRGKGELISEWGDNTKQARVFRHYADLVVLADGVILGNGWAAQ